MRDPQISQPDRSYAALAARLGGRLISVTDLAGGVSAQSTLLTYSVRGEERRAVVRELSRLAGKGDRLPAMERMFRLLRRLQDQGLRAPTPVLLDAAGELLGEPILVLEHLEDDGRVPAPQDVVEALASLLVRVHAVPAEVLEEAGLPVLTDPTAEAREVLSALGFAPGDINRHVGHPAGRADGYVLVHGDFWPGNVLWRAGQVSGLIDWEDASLGDPEADLATAKTELTLAYDSAVAAEFLSRYVELTSCAIDQHRLDLWTVCSAGGMLMGVGEWGLEPQREARVRQVARQVLADVVERLTPRS